VTTDQLSVVAPAASATIPSEMTSVIGLDP
jgi:hypothetical protein